MQPIGGPSFGAGLFGPGRAGQPSDPGEGGVGGFDNLGLGTSADIGLPTSDVPVGRLDLPGVVFDNGAVNLGNGQFRISGFVAAGTPTIPAWLRNPELDYLKPPPNIEGALAVVELGVNLTGVGGIALSIYELASGRTLITDSSASRTLAGIGLFLPYARLGRLAAPADDAIPMLRHDPTSAGKLVPYYPPNRGFDGLSAPFTLLPGTQLDRFGSNFGSFLSPARTPMWQRSLPFGSETRALNQFEVVRPFTVDAGVVAPWFNQLGGGLQFDLGRRTVQDLIDQGFLRQVGK